MSAGILAALIPPISTLLSIYSYEQLKAEKRKLQAELAEVAGDDELLRLTFDRHDIDHSGFLEIDEVTAALNEISEEEVTPEEIYKFIGSMDSDRSGAIDFEEFQQAYKAMCVG